MTPLSILLIAWTAAAALFAGCFVWAWRIRNFGLVDVVWSAGFAGVTGLAAWLGAAPIERRVGLVITVGCWSLRLAWHLAVRVTRLHPEEDGRYQDLRQKWRPHLGLKMAAFFQAQGLVLVGMSWPFIAIASDPAPKLHPLEWIGFVIVLCGVVGESMADAQLAKFKADPSHRGKVCEAGLWRHSRHPNYFFEWVIWIGFSACASQAPLGWLALACPLFMLYLLLFATGIPYTEAQLERSKGEAYRAYRARTPVFVPWIRFRRPDSL